MLFPQPLCALALFLVGAGSLLVSASSSTGPNQCISFDASWNLLAFNFDGKDYNAGPPSSSTAVKDITSQPSRPPFNVASSSPLCFLSQFTNAIYVLNADATDLSSVYIFDATAGTWSKQPTLGAPTTYDPSVFGAILDHDTNVFYALSGGTLYSLDMALLKAGTSTPLQWNDVQRPELGASGDGASGAQAYEPVMALAQNHIHFLGVPGSAIGSAKIFVIHFSYLQPDAQVYGSFPVEHGKTASFFKDSGVQTQFAYIPDDGSFTYVVDVISNSTTSFPAPPVKDQYAQYAASPSALVQLASQGGAVNWMPYNPSSTSSSWKSLSAIPVASNTPGSAGAAPSSSSAASSPTASPGKTSGVNSSSANGTTANTSLGSRTVGVKSSVVVMGFVGVLLSVGGLLGI